MLRILRYLPPTTGPTHRSAELYFLKTLQLVECVTRASEALISVCHCGNQVGVRKTVVSVR